MDCPTLFFVDKELLDLDKGRATSHSNLTPEKFFRGELALHGRQAKVGNGVSEKGSQLVSTLLFTQQPSDNLLSILIMTLYRS